MVGAVRRDADSPSSSTVAGLPSISFVITAEAPVRSPTRSPRNRIFRGSNAEATVRARSSLEPMLGTRLSIGPYSRATGLPV